jgi:cyclic beta-1,2-glucan synthetase
VYALAVELIRHSDSRLDRPQLVRFLDSFQTVAPLTIGELWAWPSMLKLALIENLRRLATELLAARAARRAADDQVETIDAAANEAEQPRSIGLPSAHVVQLLRRVREYGPRLAGVRRGLQARLAAEGRTPEEVIRAEHQREATAQVSVANVITSLRLCAQLDWSQYVEAVCPVERVLRRDPAGVHVRMDFNSRDRYRQVVEELAGPTGEAQVRVALRAVESARLVAETDSPAARAAHVGYHLIGRGRRGLEADIAWRPGPLKVLRRAAFAQATTVYLLGLALFTAGAGGRRGRLGGVGSTGGPGAGRSASTRAGQSAGGRACAAAGRSLGAPAPTAQARPHRGPA